MLLDGVLRVAGLGVCGRPWGWLVLALAGCQHSRRDEPQAPPIGVLEPGDGQRTPDVAVVVEGQGRGQLAAPPPVVAGRGQLAAAPPGARLWADRVCVEAAGAGGHRLVVDNDCGCNDGLLCEPGVAGPGRLELGLRLDPDRQPMCDDCFPMVPGRCALPVLSPGQWTVTLAGAPLFELVVDGAGQPGAGCWTRVGR